jgi:pilus assembly protein CpaC
VTRSFQIKSLLAPLALIALVCCSSVLVAESPLTASQQPSGSGDGAWTITVGKSMVIDSPLPIERISLADGALADAVGIGPKEVLIIGKAPGETSLIVWQNNGSRLVYDLSVRMSPVKLDAAKQQILREFPDNDINLTVDNDTAFVRGSVKDTVAADRVMAIASTLGKSVNLLRVDVPAAESQILVKVRFANVARSASTELALNLASTAFNQISSVGTGSALIGAKGFADLTLSGAANIFLFRPDLDLAAVLKALQTKNLLEMLAEPTVPAINGKQASFVAGGEFPFPMVQPGSAGGTVTIAWREFGVRLNFLPIITPRGSIRLQVSPEVSSLDYSRAVTVQGTTVPSIATRRVQTEIELESGQSFVIAGLIDNQVSEAFSKIPGLGDIPVLGKLFQSRSTSRNNNELLVIVTPEIVRPIPAAGAVPELKYPKPFMTTNTDVPIRHPGIDKTGEAPVNPQQTMPVEQYIRQEKQMRGEAPASGPSNTPSEAPAAAVAPAPAAPASK